MKHQNVKYLTFSSKEARENFKLNMEAKGLRYIDEEDIPHVDCGIKIEVPYLYYDLIKRG